MKKKRVICTKEDSTYLTFGKTYEVEDERYGWFQIIDDYGDVCHYLKDNFSVVEEKPKVSFIQWIKNFING